MPRLGLSVLGKEKQQKKLEGAREWDGKKESRTIDNGSGSTIEQVLKINW